MSRLRVVDVDAVEKDSNLFVGPPTNTDVSLCPNRATLADIDTSSELKKVIHTLRRSGGNSLTIQHSYQSRRLPKSERGTTTGHFHLFQFVEVLLIMLQSQ